MKSDNSFLKGTLILTVSSIVVKVIGALNWILLSRVLGGEGIGLYQMGFPIYLMAITVSSAGIPVAISIVTAEKVAKNDFKGAERVFHVTLRLLFVTGLVFSLALFFGAQKLIDWQFIRDARAYYSIIALAPAVFFVTFLASFRGYLQGWQIMTPTACSEITEQLVRVVTMLFFASYFLPKGLAAAAGGASMGAGAGAFCALLVLMFFYQRLKKDLKAKQSLQNMDAVPETSSSIISRLLKLALPVSLTSLMLPIVANLDLLIVPQRLEVAGVPGCHDRDLSLFYGAVLPGGKGGGADLQCARRRAGYSGHEHRHRAVGYAPGQYGGTAGHGAYQYSGSQYGRCLRGKGPAELDADRHSLAGYSRFRYGYRGGFRRGGAD